MHCPHEGNLSLNVKKLTLTTRVLFKPEERIYLNCFVISRKSANFAKGRQL